MARKPYAFFYGGYMSEAVLRAAGTSPENGEAGYVEGLTLTVGPIANLEEKEGSRVYGLLARLDHGDLDKLYGGDPVALKGAVYLPEAVLVQTLDGSTVPALTYICAALPAGTPEPAYIETLLTAAESLRLPEGYLAHIRSFAS